MKRQQDRDCLDPTIRATFADSLDLDAALAGDHPQASRWDFLLGHRASGQVIGVEAHSAKTDQISAVIRKRAGALDQLRGHLRDGATVSQWLWVASGPVQFAGMEKAVFQLAQNGIKFVGRRVRPKDLPAPTTTPGRTRRRATKRR